MVRVVYDGPGRAGKTTNLERLCGFFTTMRRGELFTPATSGQGRTLHFDWLDLEGGLIGGHRVRCQLVTVPGQHVLRSRRAHLLATADVIVFVCEASESGLRTARPMLSEILSHRTDERPLPIVLQANKQDMDGALDEHAIRDRLGIASDIPVVPSVAEEGIGVRETAVVAVRAAAELLQRHVAIHGVQSLAGRAQTEHELLDSMRAIGLDFEVPDPNALEAPLPEGRAVREDDVSAETPDHDVSAETPDHDVSAETPDHDVSAETPDHDVSAETPEDETAATRPSGRAPTRSLTRPAPAAPPAVDGTSLTERFATYDATRPTPLPKARRRTTPYRPGRSGTRTRLPSLTAPASIPDPPLPHGDIPSAQIWPPAYGRQVLRDLPLAEAVLRDDLRAQRGKADGSGSDTIVFQVDDWALKTRVGRRYPGVESGRKALIELARKKVALRRMQPPSTVLSLQIDATDVFWLWTIAPWTPSLRASMREAEEKGDQEALGHLLCAFADAAIDALRLAVEGGVVLDVHPSNFAATEAGAIYIDDDILVGSRVPAAGYALVRRVEEYARHEGAVGRYVERVEELLSDRLTDEQVATLDLARLIEDVPLRDESARDAKARFAAAARSRR